MESLRISGVHVNFGGPAGLDGVDVEARRGDLRSVGPNGCGKTTLSIASSLFRSMAGSIHYRGTNLGRSGRRHRGVGIRDVPEHQLFARAPRWTTSSSASLRMGSPLRRCSPPRPAAAGACGRGDAHAMFGAHGRPGSRSSIASYQSGRAWRGRWRLTTVLLLDEPVPAATGRDAELRRSSGRHRELRSPARVEA